jgi:hypothetical protein
MMPELNRFWSTGIEQVIGALSPSGPAGYRQFPASADRERLKMRNEESVREWLSRCIEGLDEADRPVCEVEDNLALFVSIAWKNTNELCYANIQALCAEASLKEYLSQGNSVNATYMRLDYDYSALGAIFTHPFPHVHPGPVDAPRFALEGIQSANVVIDFFDFIYRHFFHDQWKEWAETIWDYYVETGRDIDKNPFGHIVAAFNTSQYEVLAQHADDLAQMKKVWRARRDVMLPLRVNSEARSILAYHE